VRIFYLISLLIVHSQQAKNKQHIILTLR